jgi:hypothetical protein
MREGLGGTDENGVRSHGEWLRIGSYPPCEDDSARRDILARPASCRYGCQAVKHRLTSQLYGELGIGSETKSASKPVELKALQGVDVTR